MMLAAYFFQRIAGGGQEVGIGREDAAIHAELDHRLRFFDGGQLPRRLGRLLLLRRDVGRELDHFVRPPVLVKHRVVGGLDPYLAPPLAEAPVLPCIEFTAAQSRPEVAVSGTARVLGIDEQGVMPALDLIQAISHCLQEVVIGLQDGAVEGELDDRLHPMQCSNLGLKLDVPPMLLGYFRGAALPAQHPLQHAQGRPTGEHFGRRLSTFHGA